MYILLFSFSHRINKLHSLQFFQQNNSYFVLMATSHLSQFHVSPCNVWMHVDPEFDPLVSVPQEFTLGPSIPLLTQTLEQGCG